MKRIGNIWNKFLSYENFDLAERIARRGKLKSPGVEAFDRDNPTPEVREQTLLDLIEKVRSGNYHSTPPATFRKVTSSGKVRNISIVPYFPDIIYAHAVLNVIEHRFEKSLVYDVYSYNKGAHLLAKRLQHVIHSWPEDKPLIILKIDITKFYESILNEILKKQITGKYVKDKYLLYAIYEILDTHKGITIGMLLAQLFSSIYLADFDRFVKGILKVKRYYRYADDIIFLHTDKKYLHEIAHRVQNYLWYELGLELKYRQIFNIKDRPLDYVGYVFHRTHTLVRKRIKKNFIKRRHNRKSAASYLGTLKWCNSRHLIYKILEEDNNAKRCTA